MEPAASDAQLEELHLEWGVNRWVLLERNGRSIQRQVSNRTELAVAIREVGDATWKEALDEAEALWRNRPAGAGARLAQGRQSMVGATGLSTRAVFAALALFLAIWFIVIVALVR
jgi:hypothetical protein